MFLYLHETMAAVGVDAPALAHVGEPCVLEKAQVRVLVRFKNGCRKGWGGCSVEIFVDGTRVERGGQETLAMC